MRLLAIDPGPTMTGFVIYDTETRKLHHFGKIPTEEVARKLDEVHDTLDFAPPDYWRFDRACIEGLQAMGMAVGKEVFETAYWFGQMRYQIRRNRNIEPGVVFRNEEKMELCGSCRAKDKNIRQAILDLYGGKEVAIGKKKTPGPLYKVTADVWSALAVGITYERRLEREATSSKPSR